MARPHKPGLDYFPQDTDIFHDKKIKRLISGFGAKGFMIHEYIKTLVYGDKGYYIKNDNDFAFDVADFLGNGITEQLVKETIAGCIKLGLFNESLVDRFGILSSSGIQKRYLFAKRNGVIDVSMRVITEETPVITATIPERKEKNIKGKERKEEDLARAEILEKLSIFLKKHTKKYYPSQVQSATNAILKYQNLHNITEEKLKNDPEMRKKWESEDERIFNFHIGNLINVEVEKCYNYYAKKNFKIDGEVISNWHPVMAGWMDRRGDFKKKA